MHGWRNVASGSQTELLFHTFLRTEKRAGPGTATGATNFIFPRAATESLPYRFGRGHMLTPIYPKIRPFELKPQVYRIKYDDPRHIENRPTEQEYLGAGQYPLRWDT